MPEQTKGYLMLVTGHYFMGAVRSIVQVLFQSGPEPV